MDARHTIAVGVGISVGAFVWMVVKIVDLVEDALEYAVFELSRRYA